MTSELISQLDTDTLRIGEGAGVSTEFEFLRILTLTFKMTCMFIDLYITRGFSDIQIYITDL